MLTKLLVAPLFIAASAVAHPAVSVLRRGDVPLSEWSSGNLESYWRFKNRYNSLSCASQTGTDFYNNCCYPLGASDSLSNRPAECTPATLTCGSPVVSTTPTPTPNASTQSTSTSGNSNDDYDESSLPYCEPGQDEYGDDDTYTDASYNNGASSSSPDTYTPPASSDNSQPQPTDSGNSGNNNNGGGDTSSGNWITGGMATYYYQNGNAGACGDVHGEYDLIGAIDVAWYGDMGQRSQYCGRSVRIKNVSNGRTVDIIVADVCPTCVNNNSFDLSVGAFQAIADLSTGTMSIEWEFL